MIFLLGSIVTSCILVILFRIYQNQNVSLIQAITVNYWICVGCGVIYNYDFFNQMMNLELETYILAILQGFLFIFMFFQIGKASHELGLSYTGLLGRLSVVIPVSFSIFYFHENISFYQFLGLIFALAAIYFLSTSTTPRPIEKKHLLKRGTILFVGNGIIDSIFKIFSANYALSTPQDVFILMVFGTAGILGTFYLLIFEKKLQIRNISAGIILGIPNFFSLIFMLSALKLMDGTQFFPLNNIGIILLLTLVGLLFFKEKVYPKTWLGLTMTVVAITLISELINF